LALLFVASVSAVNQPQRIHFDSTCDFCEFVVKTAEGYIVNNETEAKIMNFLNNACTILPAPYAALCTQELNQWGAEVIQWIANDENPGVVCAQLNFCAADKEVAAALLKSPKQSTCSVCELVATFVENYLEKGGTINNLEAAVDKVCSVLPSPFDDQCTQFVAQQLPALVQWIINKEDPQSFCTQAGLCSSAKKVAQVNKPEQGSCSICELVVTFAENYLEKNSSLPGLEKALEEVCDVLPSPFSDQCDQFVEQQLPALIQWLINKENPDAFCTQAGLCSSKVQKHFGVHKNKL